MNNISLYNVVCSLKDRLENNPDSTKEQIKKAISLLNQVNYILDTHERRGYDRTK
jgi:hypothetical protein